MKTFINLMSLILTLLVSTQLTAQTEKIKQWEKNSFKAYEKTSVFMWKQLASDADNYLKSEKAGEEIKTAAIKLKYGFLYACLSSQDKDTYELYLDKTLEQIKSLLKQYPESSEIYAISAALMSVQMGFSPMKGTTLGALSGQHIDSSIKLDSLNAMAWRQCAGAKFFTPKIWGGDINEAIAKYNYSITLYESQNLLNDWTYVDALIWLGIAYQKTKDNENAKHCFEKALEVAPEHSWVKNQLLPSVSQL